MVKMSILWVHVWMAAIQLRRVDNSLKQAYNIRTGLNVEYNVLMRLASFCVMMTLCAYLQNPNGIACDVKSIPVLYWWSDCITRVCVQSSFAVSS